MSFEYLQGQKLYNLTGQPVPVLSLKMYMFILIVSLAHFLHFIKLGEDSVHVEEKV